MQIYTVAITANGIASLATAAPTIAAAAAVASSPVTGTTTILSVLGADDGGESKLTYTWATTGTPPAAVAFSANGTNAAKATTVTFFAPGVYSFLVTAVDTFGLEVTSSVGVQVNSTLTTIKVSPASVNLNAGQGQQFAALGLDQFGVVLASQPTFTWTATAGSISGSGFYTAPTSPAALR